MDQTPIPAFKEWTVVGEHNSDLPKSTQRILEGKSWLKTETVIIMPAAEMVPMRCVATWMNLMRPPNQSAPHLPTTEFIPLLGMEVGDAYSQVVEGILAHPQLSQHKYILTIEHDNTVPQDGLLNLIKHMETHPEFAAISGLYWTKGPGGVPQIWGDIKDPLPNYRPQPPRTDGGLIECWGLGMGFCLFRMEMFRDRRFPRPLFKTKCSKDEGVGTQDLSFWSEAKKLGYRCAVACDVLVGHHDSGYRVIKEGEAKTW